MNNRDMQITEPVAWLHKTLNMPFVEPQKGVWLSFEAEYQARSGIQLIESVPLYAAPQAPAAEPVNQQVLDALNNLRAAFVVAVGDKSPFAKMALSGADKAIAAAEQQARPEPLTDREIAEISETDDLWDRPIAFARAILAAAEAKRGGHEMDNPNQLLADLVKALDTAFICNMQSTHAWDKQLALARELEGTGQ